MNYINKTLEVINSTIDNNIALTQIDEDFSSFNIDSITFIKIVVALEEAFSIEFDDEMLSFTAFPTIRSMAEYIEYKASQR